VLRITRVAAVALAAGTALAAVTGAGVASAAPTHHLHVWKTLPGDYVGPLQFAVSGKRVAVADSFASALYLVGQKNPIATGPAPSQNPEASGDLSGVDIRNGRIAYTTATGDHLDTRLIVLDKHGHQVVNANLAKYEKHHNPDGHVQYGATKPSEVSAACSAALAKQGQPVSYTGLVDSHPYAVAGLADGSWLVADAGANDILRVSGSGRISTVAVLPTQPVKITTALAAELGVPECAGITYRFEAVPTDVEAANGRIYATTLPGGAGGLGSVYSIDRHGRTHRIATGFVEATNLAVSPSGCIYVVELGQGVYTPAKGGPRLVAALPNAAGVEWADGHLYASTAPIAATEGADTSPGHIVILK
jgi:hypothetical protein